MNFRRAAFLLILTGTVSPSLYWAVDYFYEGDMLRAIFMLIAAIAISEVINVVDSLTFDLEEK